MTQRIAEKDTFIHYVLLMLVCGLIMATTSGCAGLELGGKLGIYRVDERFEKQKTYRNPKPAICYLLPSRCTNNEAAPDPEEMDTK